MCKKNTGRYQLTEADAIDLWLYLLETFKIHKNIHTYPQAQAHSHTESYSLFHIDSFYVYFGLICWQISSPHESFL